MTAAPEWARSWPEVSWAKSIHVSVLHMDHHQCSVSRPNSTPAIKAKRSSTSHHIIQPTKYTLRPASHRRRGRSATKRERGTRLQDTPYTHLRYVTSPLSYNMPLASAHRHQGSRDEGLILGLFTTESTTCPTEMRHNFGRTQEYTRKQGS